MQWTLSHEKELTIDLHKNIDESQIDFAKGKATYKIPFM